MTERLGSGRGFTRKDQLPRQHSLALMLWAYEDAHGPVCCGSRGKHSRAEPGRLARPTRQPVGQHQHGQETHQHNLEPILMLTISLSTLRSPRDAL